MTKLKIYDIIIEKYRDSIVRYNKLGCLDMSVNKEDASNKELFRGQLKFFISRLVGVESIRYLDRAIRNKDNNEKFVKYLRNSVFGSNGLCDFEGANKAEYSLRVVFRCVEDFGVGRNGKVDFKFKLQDNPGEKLSISNEYFVEHFKLEYYEVIVTIPESFKGKTDKFVDEVNRAFKPYVDEGFYYMEDGGCIGAYIGDNGMTKGVYVRPAVNMSKRCKIGETEIKNVIDKENIKNTLDKENIKNTFDKESLVNTFEYTKDVSEEPKPLCNMCKSFKSLNPFCPRYVQCKNQMYTKYR